MFDAAEIPVPLIMDPAAIGHALAEDRRIADGAGGMAGFFRPAAVASLDRPRAPQNNGRHRERPLQWQRRRRQAKLKQNQTI